ncbi:50S ribosomal protein L6 [Candidatus Pacearchaeota archaeon]|nr:50S ribosomal protein L6 [Candidatus Pacearchaeota archaeon]
MKENINEKIEFPESFDFGIENSTIYVKTNGREVKKTFNLRGINVEKSGNSLIFNVENGTKRHMKIIKTIIAHLKNVILGLKEDFIYKLEIAYVHFPATLEINKEKREFYIKNFLGEKRPRIAKIIPGAEVSIERNIITIKSHDKEIAGQMAANLEMATKIKNRDRRKFQDGIFIIEKSGRKI